MLGWLVSPVRMSHDRRRRTDAQSRLASDLGGVLERLGLLRAHKQKGSKTVVVDFGLALSQPIACH